jgi:Protein of unknown function (DUF2934)
MAKLARMESQYRSAFEDFSRKALRVQQLTEHPTGDRGEFETALLELEKAHLAYDEARDALVHLLLPAAPPLTADDDHCADIRTVAELLWESAGRPTGTEEEDWQRAEAIVQTALKASACAA